MVRTRVRRGGLRKGKVHMKRKPSKAGIAKITMAKNTQRIAEERVNRHFPNLEVLNSTGSAKMVSTSITKSSC